MSPKSLDLSIIILNYNTQDWLQNCLEKLDQFPPKKISGEVIVVDNASKDASVAMVKKNFPRVKVIESKVNGGFSAGNNLGIKEAKGRYIMLLNSDAEFTEQTDLDAMIKYLDKREEVGVMTPKLVLPDGSIDLASHRGEPTPWAALTYFGKFERIFPHSKFFGQYHQTWQNFEKLHEIEACSGAAMIVRHSTLKDVGLLDESFFMYAEDLDWCRRFREAGYKIMYFPESIVIHHKYKSGRGKAETEQTAQPIATEQFLQIPGFAPEVPQSQPTQHSAEHHFWETMKQYYTKHYAKSSPIQTWLVHRGVDLVKKMKKKS